MPRGGHDIPMSGTHLKGTHEVVTKGVDPTRASREVAGGSDGGGRRRLRW